MTPSLSVDHLNSRFLDGLAKPERESILNAATERRFDANSVVTDQGQPADHLFLLTKGRGRFFFITEDGRKLILLWLPAGEILGVRTLLPVPSSYVASAEVLRESWALVWDRNTIRDLAARYPRLLDNALLIASEYLAEHMESYIALTRHNARQRLAHVLTTIAPSVGRKVPKGIELDVTNEELANAANVTLFTASRVLSEWQRTGDVLKSRGKLLLRCPERLLGQSA
ncbi:MAG TPA: Crp/Fnr family transcriptional regulator [Candidatus Binatia bacterium]|nr:Crp/Fnr family transcriptional regulator [Candidatus Binatia bacterium]